MAKRTIHRERVRIRVGSEPEDLPEPTSVAANTPSPPPLFWVVIGGLLVIVLLAMVNNNNRAEQVRPAPAQVALPAATSTPTLKPTNTPEPKNTPTPTLTPTPRSENIETGNPAITITLQQDESLTSRGSLVVKWLMYDSRVNRLEDIDVHTLVVDVAGNFAVKEDRQAVDSMLPNELGLFYADLDPYPYYLLTRGDRVHDDQNIVPGWYIDEGLDDNRGRRGIIFPVKAGMATNIDIIFSRLIVGVLNEEGTRFKPTGGGPSEWRIRLCSNQGCARESLDKLGMQTFHLVPGNYSIILHQNSNTSCWWTFPVTVGLQEEKTEAVTLHLNNPSACP